MSYAYLSVIGRAVETRLGDPETPLEVTAHVYRRRYEQEVITKTIGKVNDRWFSMAAPGTLLFQGSSCHVVDPLKWLERVPLLRRLRALVLRWRIDLYFAYRGRPWNTFVDACGVEREFLDRDGNSLYESADLRPLFDIKDE